MKLELDKSWMPYLGEELSRPYMQELFKFLEKEKAQGKKIYPDESLILEAFRLTPFDKVKVVILGQDPYHGEGQAHGLCFSVKKGVKPPPSLVNIYKEFATDTGHTIPDHGNLEAWAKQGVLLLNTVLTVEDGMAQSHQKQGWENFTDKVIEILNIKKENLVFILWGSPAQKKAAKVDSEKHCILKAVHPSPLSYYRGFLGSRPFSQTNEYLTSKGITPIDWRL
jgi:uracil-DNA glycosylase